MSAVERLRRTGQYLGEAASKSVGVGYYLGNKQADEIKELLGYPKQLQIERVMVTLLSVLAPATIYSSLSEDNNSSEPKKILSKFKTGAKVIGALGIDLSTLVGPIAASVSTKNSLPLLGMLGKPLYNAMFYMAYDAINARAFKRKDLPRGPEGTYDLFEEAYDEYYDPRLKVGVIKDPQGGVKAVIRKEEICAESGGSCMVLSVPITDGENRGKGYSHAHVTQKDVVVNIGTEGISEAPPKIEDLIEGVRISLRHTEIPVHQ